MLTDDARDIWQHAVDAVSSERLVANVLHRHGDRLTVGGREFDLSQIDTLVVVGAGKAGAGMSSAVEEQLGSDVVTSKVAGWVNVPADCVRPLQRIHLHAARPAGLYEPTSEGVAGALQILRLVERMRENDLAIVLLSGGGSALLPAPLFGISLEDKQAITRALSRAGASIHELNTVRKQLSLIKGGGLARAARRGQMAALVISDVIGDPLDIIASGPTIADSGTPHAALEILDRLLGLEHVPPAIVAVLREKAETKGTASIIDSRRITTEVIGNNAIAVDAAAQRARSLGYAAHVLGTGQGGFAADYGREFARQCLAWRSQLAPGARVCLISGGEPVVKLTPTDLPRRGGRNQELVLAATEEIFDDGATGIALLSGGTDGEDGPTDAAGAFIDASVIQRARHQELTPAPFLAINNSYEFFDKVGGLLKTGPTHTNVMDVRVACVEG